MKRLTALAAAATALVALTATLATARTKPVAKPKIQMAILLDTSGSMQGLINQARTHLWKIVNEFAAAKRNGIRPTLEVALYEYGKSTISREEGHLRMITPLTTDLDKVSEELFALTTNGGDEWAGKVIRSAVDGLQWSKSKRDLKMIFIAGNEPFTQGPVDYKVAVKGAIKKGITVSTIHCGPEAQGVAGKWKDGADLADGSFMTINHNARIVHIKAPQDAELARLGRELNKTYIGYGAKAKVMEARQEKQDDNAAGAGGMAQRAATKASGYYDNSHWDIVDAVKKNKVKLSDSKNLPSKLQKMSLAERKAYIAKVAKKRDALKAKIKKLSAERNKYVAAERKKSAAKGSSSLDEAISKEVKRQGKKKKFSFSN